MQESPYLKGKSNLLENLKRMPAFQEIQDSNLLNMLELSKIRKYEPGEQIMEEGAFDCWVYFLISGKVRVEKQGSTLCEMENHGDMFGEMSVVDGSARSASVFAITDTMCLAMDASGMERIAPEQRNAFYAVMYRFMAEVLAERLRRADAEIARLTAKLGA